MKTTRLLVLRIALMALLTTLVFAITISTDAFAESDGFEPRVMKTPKGRFSNLVDYNFQENYIGVTDFDPRAKAGSTLRMHYVDVGSKSATETILLLHGVPTWSFMYRNVIPILAAEGYRVIAPDLIGFGKSDKPCDKTAYTAESHYQWMKEFIETLNLHNVTLVGQDWGGFIGLRLVGDDFNLNKSNTRYIRVIATNTTLSTAGAAGLTYTNRFGIPVSEPLLSDGRFPDGMGGIIPVFALFRSMMQSDITVKASDILSAVSFTPLSNDIKQGYDAPFPDERYKAGFRQFPDIVPHYKEDPSVPANVAAWIGNPMDLTDGLKNYDKPFMTLFSGADQIFKAINMDIDLMLQQNIVGAAGQTHVIIGDIITNPMAVDLVGHFVVEERPIEFANAIINFIKANP